MRDQSFNFPVSLRSLQRRQFQHDRDFHADIVSLPLAQRFRHLAFHQLKYGCQLLAAVRDGDDGLVNRLITDSFIIGLSLANALQQDLAADLSDRAENPRSSCAVASESEKQWVEGFILVAGPFAKLGEALDHLEAIDFRSAIAAANREMVAYVIEWAGAQKLDLEDGFRSRLAAVEKMTALPWTKEQ